MSETNARSSPSMGSEQGTRKSPYRVESHTSAVFFVKYYMLCKCHDFVECVG